LRAGSFSRERSGDIEAQGNFSNDDDHAAEQTQSFDARRLRFGAADYALGKLFRAVGWRNTKATYANAPCRFGLFPSKDGRPLCIAMPVQLLSNEDGERDVCLTIKSI